MFQNTWHRYLVYLLGSQSEATATIIAVFLGGMSAGYFLYGRLSRVFHRSLFKLYGVTEFAIGIWAIFSPKLYTALSGVPISYFWQEIGVTLCFLVPPTLLMGGTIPVLTQALSSDLQSATRTHSTLYGLNTLGAAGGCLIAGFYLLPSFGLPMTLIGGGMVNVFVGLIFYGMKPTDRLEAAVSTSTVKSKDADASKQVSKVGWLWVVAFIAGFVTIGLETLLIRLVGLSAGSSTFSFSLIVAIFILCIALGGLLVSRLKSLPPGSLNWLLLIGGLSLLALYNSIEAWPYYFHVLRTFFSSNAETFWVFQIVLGAALTLILLIPISLSGAVLPLCFHYSKRNMDALGADTGKLYALNTLGCVFGALLGGFYLLYWLDMNQVFFFLICLVQVSLLISLANTRRMVGKRILTVLVAGVLIFTALLGRQPLWDKEYFGVGLFRTVKKIPSTFSGYRKNKHPLPFFFLQDGPTATVSVFKFGFEDRREIGLSIVVNGKVDSNTHPLMADYLTIQLLGHMPVLLAEKPENVAVIGFGTGVTAGAVGQYGEVKNVDVVELNPMVLKAAPWFEPFNYRLLENPKIQLHNVDAFRFFRNRNAAYDVVISEPSNPWMMGVANLFSRDFYQLAHQSLAQKGVFFQWIHGYSLSRETFLLIMNTFQSVFEHLYLFKFNVFDYGLLGTKEPLSKNDLLNLEKRLELEKDNQAIRDIGLTDVEQYLALERMGEEDIGYLTKGRGLHTLENPKLGYWAAVDFFSRANARMPEGDGLLSKWRKGGDSSGPIAFPAIFCKHNPKVCKKYKGKR